MIYDIYIKDHDSLNIPNFYAYLLLWLAQSIQYQKELLCNVWFLCGKLIIVLLIENKSKNYFRTDYNWSYNRLYLHVYRNKWNIEFFLKPEFFKMFCPKPNSLFLSSLMYLKFSAQKNSNFLILYMFYNIVLCNKTPWKKAKNRIESIIFVFVAKRSGA